jgi:broad-specificity NMP kinase
VFLLVTGAGGAGKSTVRARVQRELSPIVECMELAQIVDVPAIPTIARRQRATEAVVRRAVELQKDGRHLLLSGNPVAAGEVAAAPSASALDGPAVCLLDVSPEAQAERLAARGDDPGLLRHHQAFAEWMRRHADDPLHMSHVLSADGWDEMRWDRLAVLAPDWQMVRIDTTDMTRDRVADAVVEWCRRVLAAEASIVPWPDPSDTLRRRVGPA